MENNTRNWYYVSWYSEWARDTDIVMYNVLDARLLLRSNIWIGIIGIYAGNIVYVFLLVEVFFIFYYFYYFYFLLSQPNAILLKMLCFVSIGVNTFIHTYTHTHDHYWKRMSNNSQISFRMLFLVFFFIILLFEFEFFNLFLWDFK